MTMVDEDHSFLEFTREIRDPIYGYIPLTELECHIIDTPEFQRLDRIRQMHAGYKVYPNARYSRKAHSLGAMHLAGKAISRLLYLQDNRLPYIIPSLIYTGKNSRKDYRDVLDNLGFLRTISAEVDNIDCEDLKKLDTAHYEEIAGQQEESIERLTNSTAWIVQSVRLLGLLHDAGHGPFSHMLEHIEGVEFDHNETTPLVIGKIEEKATERIREDDREMAELCSQMLNFVQNILETGDDIDEDITFLRQLTDCPFDVDMLDYLVRDSYFAGTPEYGQIDVERIIRGFVVHDGSLRISRSAMTAVNDALDSYFETYKAVYTHKTVIMYEIILNEALKKFHETAGIPFATEEGIDLDEFLKYDDRRLISDIEDTDPDSECWSNFKDFQDREKPYKQLLFYTVNIDTEKYTENRQKEVSKEVEKIVEDIAEDEEIRLPHRSIDEIKRAGISLDDLKDWVSREIIYNPSYEEPDEAFQSFTESNVEMGRRIKQIEVNVRIFTKQDSIYDEDVLRNRLEEELLRYEEELQESIEESR